MDKDEPPKRIPDWETTLEEWTAYGLLCRIKPGYTSLNGYVQFPPLPLSRETVESIFDVHWGITWGPDADGWIGFDTAHAFDYWAPDDLIEHLSPEGFKVAMMINELAQGAPYVRRWTYAKLRAETEQLAQQVAVALDLATGIEAPTFTCPRCEAISHHPKDVEFGYCGACHDFTLRKV